MTIGHASARDGRGDREAGSRVDEGPREPAGRDQAETRSPVPGEPSQPVLE